MDRCASCKWVTTAGGPAEFGIKGYCQDGRLGLLLWAFLSTPQLPGSSSTLGTSPPVEHVDYVAKIRAKADATKTIFRRLELLLWQIFPLQVSQWAPAHCTNLRLAMQEQPGVTSPNKRRVRSGCLTCRKRRRKCDEGKPTCQNCRTRNLECQYGLNITFVELRR